MGLLRVIYATTVISLHTSTIFGFSLLSRDLAVWSFFIISGFYMGLILNEKYIGKRNSYQVFITNRFLRIFPAYLVILLLTFILCLILEALKIPNPLHDYLLIQKNPLNQIVDVVRNITLIVGPEYFYKPKNFPNYLFLSQAWTLQLELLFYLFAPFLFRRRWKAIVLVLMIILFFDYRFVFPYQLFYGQPIIYRFFENVIFFLIGGLSYKLYVFCKQISWSKKVLVIIYLSFVAGTIFYNFIHLSIPFVRHHHTDWPYYIFLADLIPIIFILTKKNVVDHLIGQLSYPMYISHTFVILLISSFWVNIVHVKVYSVLIIAASILFSLLLVRVVEYPLDIIRQRRLKELAKNKKSVYTLADKVNLYSKFLMYLPVSLRKKTNYP